MIFDIGFERWAKYQRMFGFGSKTGVDLNSESPGIVPDPEYYDKVYGEGKWTKGNLVSLAIGQGELSVTPVQLAQYTAFIANRGETVTPHLVKGMIRNANNNFVPFKYDKKEIDVSKETIDYVRKGMHEVMHGDEGTARWYRVKGIEMAGKTGTSQNPHGEDHALFVAFAPYENPQIAVAVIVENVGFGSTHAAPVARDVIDTYLNSQKNKNIENLVAEKLSEKN
jgi:penicillin-binding protein 2